MRKITFFKTMLVAIALVIGSLSASGQVTLPHLDPLNYTVGQGLQTQTNWTSLNSGDALLIATGNLSYPGLPTSTGNKVTFDAAGIDAAKSFAQQTSGTVYYSFLLNISALGSLNTTGGYFTGLNEGTSTSYGATVWTRADGVGYDLGINPRTTAANTQWSTINAINTTVFVVISYQIVSSTANDIVRMWINPTPGSTEPAATLTATNAGTDLLNLNRILLRQDAAATTPFIEMDELRIGTSWADVTPASSVITVDAPTFLPSSGSYTSNQNVVITTTTSGADIYYTTDGSTPDATTTKYTTAIPVTSTTTIKAVAIKSGMSDGTNAATYTFPTELSNLAALRTASQTGFYKVTGEVFATFQSTAGKVKYIQDATAGIVVYDGSGKITTPYTFGDGIKNIYCTLSLFNGTLELIPFNDPGAPNSTGNTIAPKSISISDLNTGNYQGQLVKISNLTITGTGNFASGTAYTINDGVTDGKLKVAYSDVDYIGKMIPTSPQDITGVIYNSTTSEIDLVPRATADFSAGLTTGLKEVTANKIYAFNGKITLTASANQTIEIYNSVGQKLISKQAVEGLNTIAVSTRGVVFVKVENRTAKLIL